MSPADIRRLRERTLALLDASASGTDTFRVAAGPRDGLPGIALTEFAGHRLAETRDLDHCPTFLEPLPGHALYWKPLGDPQPPRHIAGPRLDQPFLASESGARFWIDFNTGCSQGLFPDQRQNRSRLRSLIRSSRTPDRRPSTLNLFAYTCAFGVAAALENSDTLNIDLSRKYLDWGKRNYLANQIDPASHGFLAADARDALRRLDRQRRRFDFAILDPPSFARSKSGGPFNLDRDLPALVGQTAGLLLPGGSLLCCTNQRSLSLRAFREMVDTGLARLPNAGRWTLLPGEVAPDYAGDHPPKSLWLRAPTQ